MTSANRKSPKTPLRLKALSYVLIYVVLAGLWILLSGIAVEMFAGYSALRNELEIYKGLVFVLMTGLALYALLRAWQSDLPDAHINLLDDETARIGGATVRLPIIYVLGEARRDKWCLFCAINKSHKPFYTQQHNCDWRK